VTERCRELIHFLDSSSNQGASFPQSWGEGVGVEGPGIAALAGFVDADWVSLKRTCASKTDTWVECLVFLLSSADDSASRGFLVQLALDGRDENLVDAMEHIQEFRDELPAPTRRALDSRLEAVLRSRIEKASEP